MQLVGEDTENMHWEIPVLFSIYKISVYFFYKIAYNYRYGGGHRRKMENDEKRKKVIDELDRRKKIIEKYLDSNSSFEDRYKYVCRKNWYYIIGIALDFVRDNFVELNECDYSTCESYRESIDECCKKSPLLMLMTHKIVNNNFNAVVSYIGIVIDDINDNHYPVDHSEIFEEIIW